MQLYSQTISPLPREKSAREISCPQMQSGGANPSIAKFNLIAARLSILRARLVRRTPPPPLTDFSFRRGAIFFTLLARRTRRRLPSFIQFAPRAAFSAAAFFSCAACSICRGVAKGSDWGYGVAPNGAAAARESQNRTRLIDGRYI